MTRKDMIRAAAKAAHVTQETATAVLQGAFDAAADALAAGESVKLNAIGTFKVRQHKATTTAYNFATGERMPHAAFRTVVFMPAKALKRIVNGDVEQHGTQGNGSADTK